MSSDIFVINDKNFYVKITDTATATQAFEQLTADPALARVRPRGYAIHLRPAQLTIERYAWGAMLRSTPDDPAGCMFDHDGWIFFGSI